MKHTVTLGFTLIITLVILTCSGLADDSNKVTSVFNQNWLKALVSIEVLNEKDQESPIGSGFLVSTPNNHIALVTAKHVVFDDKGNGPLRKGLAYRLNNKKGKSVLISESYTAKQTKSKWMRSKKHDVACRLIAWQDEADFLTIPYSVFLPEEQIHPGSPLLIIGFPLGLRSKEYTTPIVRRGMVARADSENVIVDAFVFPGNSGGPVVYEPTVRFGKGISTSVLQGDWLLGLVLSEISYVDTAVSFQTKRPRVTFEDNTGLCNVLPAGLILELLKSQAFVKIDTRK